MTVSLEFSLPGEWVEIPQHDASRGALMNAHMVLGRRREPATRTEAVALETEFLDMAKLMIAVEANAGFVLVPDAPKIGVLGAVILRWSMVKDVNALERAVENSLFGRGPAAQVFQQQTQLGLATIVVHFENPGLPTRLWRAVTRKEQLDIHHMSWFWQIPTEDEEMLVTLSTVINHDGNQNPVMETKLLEFALGIRRKDEYAR